MLSASLPKWGYPSLSCANDLKNKSRAKLKHTERGAAFTKSTKQQPRSECSLCKIGELSHGLGLPSSLRTEAKEKRREERDLDALTGEYRGETKRI